jgi:hypothetical protein
MALGDIQKSSHPAFCVLLSPTESSAMCALHDGRTIAGVVKLTRTTSGVTMAHDGGSTAGIDPRRRTAAEHGLRDALRRPQCGPRGERNAEP